MDVEIKALNERIAELESKLTQSESSKSRILDESKDYKQKAADLKLKVEELEKLGLEKADDKTKADAQLKKLQLLEGENKGLKNNLLDSNIRKAISKYATDVHSIEDVINQRFTSKEFGDLLKSGINQDDLSLSDDVAKDFVAKVLEAKPHFKKTIETDPIDTTKPNGKGAKDLNVESASYEDLKESLKNQIAATKN